jgi:hypothetical protein
LAALKKADSPDRYLKLYRRARQIFLQKIFLASGWACPFTLIGPFMLAPTQYSRRTPAWNLSIHIKLQHQKLLTTQTEKSTRKERKIVGDFSDMRDVDRFMRCDAGRKRLAEIQAALVGKTIAKVEFSNDVDSVLVTMSFDSGESVELFLPELMLDALRETFQAEIREEYFHDYPDRRPKPEKGTENDGETKS